MDVIFKYSDYLDKKIKGESVVSYAEAAGCTIVGLLNNGDNNYIVNSDDRCIYIYQVAYQNNTFAIKSIKEYDIAIISDIQLFQKSVDADFKWLDLCYYKNELQYEYDVKYDDYKVSNTSTATLRDINDSLRTFVDKLKITNSSNVFIGGPLSTYSPFMYAVQSNKSAKVHTIETICSSDINTNLFTRIGLPNISIIPSDNCYNKVGFMPLNECVKLTVPLDDECLRSRLLDNVFIGDILPQVTPIYSVSNFDITEITAKLFNDGFANLFIEVSDLYEKSKISLLSSTVIYDRFDTNKIVDSIEAKGNEPLVNNTNILNKNDNAEIQSSQPTKVVANEQHIKDTLDDVIPINDATPYSKREIKVIQDVVKEKSDDIPEEQVDKDNTNKTKPSLPCTDKEQAPIAKANESNQKAKDTPLQTKKKKEEILGISVSLDLIKDLTKNQINNKKEELYAKLSSYNEYIFDANFFLAARNVSKVIGKPSIFWKFEKSFYWLCRNEKLKNIRFVIPGAVYDEIENIRKGKGLDKNNKSKLYRMYVAKKVFKDTFGAEEVIKRYCVKIQTFLGIFYAQVLLGSKKVPTFGNTEGKLGAII